MQAVFSSAAVAHAARLIFDGSDAIMLSGETAMGNYPVEAVATMARIAQKAEGRFSSAAVAHAARLIAFVIFTRSGSVWLSVLARVRRKQADARAL